jgi:DNA-binding MarR family transcriptional regulator
MSKSIHDLMQAWVSLIHAATHLRRGLEEVLLTELGFGLAEQDLIKQLYVNGGALTHTELSRRIYFSKSGVTRMIDRLEDAGFVERKRVAGDRRAINAVLTPTGRDAFNRSRIILRGYVKKTLGAALADDDIAVLGSVLEKLLRAADVFDGQQRHLKGEAGGGA